MRLAIFDVDGTLISGKSTEKRFIAWLLQHGCLGPRQIASMAWHVPRRFPLFGRHVFRKNKSYLTGLTEAVVSEQASRFVASLPEVDWIRESLDELREHRERGEVVVLMSGTLQPIIDALAARVGADAAVGTTCILEAGRYADRPPLRHPFYHAKAALLEEIRSQHGVAAGDVLAYADSRFDIPLLERVGEPVAVGPDRGLAAWARTRRCRVIDYRRSLREDSTGAI